jgi:hypothetical protein
MKHGQSILEKLLVEKIIAYERAIHSLKQHHQEHHHMIPQADIDTAVAALNAASAAAVTALGSDAANSTPDASVQGLLNAVGSVTSALVAATSPVAAALATKPA